MEIVLTLGFFLSLALAAPRWGADSRDGLRSAEHALAGYGFTWQELAHGRWARV